VGFEAVLAAVGLVGDEYDVAAVGEEGIPFFVAFGRELLDGGEDNAAGGHLEEIL